MTVGQSYRLKIELDLPESEINFEVLKQRRGDLSTSVSNPLYFHRSECSRCVVVVVSTYAYILST